MLTPHQKLLLRDDWRGQAQEVVKISPDVTMTRLGVLHAARAAAAVGVQPFLAVVIEQPEGGVIAPTLCVFMRSSPREDADTRWQTILGVRRKRFAETGE